MPFDAYSEYYDLLYQDKNYGAEVDYIDALLKRFGILGTDVLEYGSGTGIHGRLLASRGYAVLGVERSEEMAARAKATSSFTTLVGDMRTTQLARSFDAVLALFHVINYQVSNADLATVFVRAAEHLHPGGLFLFDTWYSPAVSHQRPSVRVKRLQDAELRVTRIAEPTMLVNQNQVDVEYTVFAEDMRSGQVSTFREMHSMRHLSLPEIELYASQAGFELIASEEFLTGVEPSEATWGVCVVLRKR